MRYKALRKVRAWIDGPHTAWLKRIFIEKRSQRYYSFASYKCLLGEGEISISNFQLTTLSFRAYNQTATWFLFFRTRPNSLCLACHEDRNSFHWLQSPQVFH